MKEILALLNGLRDQIDEMARMEKENFHFLASVQASCIIEDLQELTGKIVTKQDFYESECDKVSSQVPY